MLVRVRSSTGAATERALSAPCARSRFVSPGSERSSSRRAWIGSNIETTASAVSDLSGPYCW